MAKQSGISPSKLRAELDRGKIAPVYMLAGEEEFFAHESVNAIAGALEGQGGDCARHTYQEQEADLATVLDDARSFGLFGQKQLVVVWPANQFVRTHGDALADFAQSPPPAGHLVLVVEKADRRKKLTKVIEKAGSLVACNPIYQNQVGEWVRDRAKQIGVGITAAAAARLADFLGTDLAVIAAELDKLATYIGDRKRIEADDVEAVSLRDRSRIIFELTDAIGARRPGPMLTILGGLLDQGERAGGIIFMVSRHMRRLWTVRELMNNGTEPTAAAHKVGVRYFVERFLDQARGFPLRQLRQNCTALAECETELKRSAMDDRVLLETTFIQLLPPARTASS